jgi:hypothetical protein
MKMNELIDMIKSKLGVCLSFKDKPKDIKDKAVNSKTDDKKAIPPPNVTIRWDKESIEKLFSGEYDGNKRKILEKNTDINKKYSDINIQDRLSILLSYIIDNCENDVYIKESYRTIADKLENTYAYKANKDIINKDFKMLVDKGIIGEYLEAKKYKVLKDDLGAKKE